MDLIVATGNAGKLRELERLLADCPVQLHSLAEFPGPEPEETATTFVENALIKARAAAQRAGMAALADDSGLLVDALDGAPGLYSARYAEMHQFGRGDQANNDLLLEQLAGLADGQRGAHFHCTCVFLRHADDPQPIVCAANWHGSILSTPRGQDGFGYDPLFLPDGLEQTSAELAAEHKNAISHRGQAIAAMLAALKHEYRWS